VAGEHPVDQVVVPSSDEPAEDFITVSIACEKPSSSCGPLRQTLVEVLSIEANPLFCPSANRYGSIHVEAIEMAK
jgi:hypothetical protein